MQNHYIIHKTIHHSPLLTLIFLHILSTRAANYRPYTLFSFPPHFVGATIGRPLSHTLPTRAANYRPTLISHGRLLVARYPIHFPLGRPMTAPTHFSPYPSFRRGDHWSPTYHTQKSHHSLTFPCKPPQNIV